MCALLQLFCLHTAKERLCDKTGGFCVEVKNIPPSTEVCHTCFEGFSSAVWLAKLRCIYPESHSNKPNVKVVCAPRARQLVKVRPYNPQISEPMKHYLKSGQSCEFGNRCSWAHSEEEYSFWIQETIKRVYQSLVSLYIYILHSIVYASMYMYYP